MKLQRFSLLLLLTTILGFGFSSCDDDYKYDTVRATLDIDTTRNPKLTSNNGTFAFYHDIYFDDIKNIYRHDDVRDVYLYSSKLWLGVDNRYLREGDPISFTLEDDYSSYFTTNLRLGSDDIGLVAYVDDRDSNYANFMERLISKVIYNGSARLYVSGDAYDSNQLSSSSITLIIQNDIDVEIRY